MPLTWTPADTRESDLREQLETELESIDAALDALDSAPLNELTERLDRISRLVTRARNTLKRL